MNSWQILSETPFSQKTTAIDIESFRHHKLAGWLYSQPEKSKALSPENFATLKKDHQKQWLNQVKLQKVAAQLDLSFESARIPVTLLKGMVLVEGVYQMAGCRSICDIDLLINPKDFITAKEILLSNDFELCEEKKWEANAFKQLFYQKSEDVMVELHTRLFYENESRIQWQTRSLSGYHHFRALEHHDQLVHLLGHLGYQHSLLMLHWLKDIDLYIRKHGKTLNWRRTVVRLKDLQQLRSAKMIFWLLRNKLDTPLPKTILSLTPQGWWADHFFSWLFKDLWKPRRTWRYYLIKMLCRDRLSDSFAYIGKWLKAYSWV